MPHFLAHFSHPRYRAANELKNRPFQAAIRVEKEGPLNPQGYARDLREILGEIATNPPPTQEALFLALISAKDASFSCEF